MKTLHIIASPRKDRSKSIMLGEYLSTFLEGDIETLNLYDIELPFLTDGVIANNYGYMSYDELSQDDKKIIEIQTKLIEQIKSIDQIIVSVPMWNFNMPAILKAYFDLIIKFNDTFTVDESGYKGLLTNVQNVYYVGARGGVFMGTEFEKYDLLNPHLGVLSWFLGFANNEMFWLEGVNSYDKDTLAEKVDLLKKQIKSYFDNKN